jgi:hypothetical protein
MVSKIIEPALPVNGVTPGQTATLDIPIGPRYHIIWLIATVKRPTTAPKLADVLSGIRVKINGNIQRSFLATELDALNTLMDPTCQARYRVDVGSTGTYGALGLGAISAGDTVQWQVPIFLAEPWRKSYAAQEVMSWPTVGQGWSLKSFQVEVDVTAVTTSGGVTANHAVTAFLEKDFVQGGAQMNICKWYRNNQAYAGSGESVNNTLKLRGVVQQISLFNSTAGGDTDAITNLKLKVNGLTYRDVTKQSNDATLIVRQMNPSGISSSRFDAVLDYDDVPSNGLPLNGSEDFQVIPNVQPGTNATTKGINIISQVYGPPD